jgi:hypothetical protein
MIELPYLTKPRRSEPCNGCGLCCQVQVCDIGQQLFNVSDKGPCPGLIYRDGRTYCGPAMGHKAGPIISRMLGIGRGCCSDDVLED